MLKAEWRPVEPSRLDTMPSQPRAHAWPPYRGGRSPHWLNVKNPAAPAAKREAEEGWR